MPATAEDFLGPAAAPVAAPATDVQAISDAYVQSGLQDAIKIQADNLSKQLEEQSFLKRNAAMDVPLEAKSGLPAWLRFNLAMEPNIQNQKQYLLSRPEVLGVRETDDGSNLIVRLQDPQSKFGIKDYLAHPTEFTGKSAASMAGAVLSSIPTIAATAMVPEVKGGGMVVDALKTIGATVAGGTATDTVVRAGQGTDPNYGEQLSRRVPEGILNAAIPAGFHALNRIQSPFGTYAGPQQRLLAEAVDALKKETGTDINLTAAQRTGSPFLARYEAFVSKLPGGGQMKTEQAAQDEAIRQTQMKIAQGTGGADVPASDVGSRAGGILSAEDQAAQSKIDALRTGAATGSQDNIVNLIGKLSTPNSSLSASEVGGAVRQRFMQLRQEFEDEAAKNYSAASAAIGPNDRIVPIQPIQDYAAKLESSNFEATKNLAPGLKRVISLADDIGKENPDGMLSLEKVRALRSLLGSSIAQGEPVGELQTSYAKGLYTTLTKAIDDGVSALNNPEAKQLLEQANSQYKQGIAQLEQTGVAKAFKTDQQSGFLSDSQIPEKVFGDIDQMRRYKDLLGENSPEYRGILRVGLDNLVSRSKNIGDTFIDAGDFLKKGPQTCSFRP